MPGAESEETEKVAALAQVHLNQSVLHTWGTQAAIHLLLVDACCVPLPWRMSLWNGGSPYTISSFAGPLSRSTSPPEMEASLLMSQGTFYSMGQKAGPTYSKGSYPHEVASLCASESSQWNGSGVLLGMSALCG